MAATATKKASRFDSVPSEMHDITATIDYSTRQMIITLPLESAGTLSSCGKSETIASSRGNQKLKINDEIFTVGVNVYKKM